MNRNPRMLLTVFPWLLSISLGTWLVVILTSDEPASAPPAEQTVASPIVESSGDELVLLRTCRNKLKTCGHKLVACRAVAASSQKKLETGRSPDKNGDRVDSKSLECLEFTRWSQCATTSFLSR